MIVVYLSTGKKEVIWAYGSTRHAKLYRKQAESELKILKKNKENVNAKSTGFLVVIIDSNLSWKYILKGPAVELAMNYL
jgi:hypothetical protein